VDHIDSDTENNHAQNLRWVTPKQNIAYKNNKLKIKGE
jgi:hypothetical protein